MSDKTEDLRVKHGQLLSEMRSTLDAAGTELTAEDSSKLEKLDVEIDAVERSLKAVEMVAARSDLPSNEEIRAAALPAVEARGIETDKVEMTEERSFTEYLRSQGQNVEARANLVAGLDANGGYLVPKVWSNELIRELALQSPVLNLAKIIQTSNGDTFNQPIAANAQTYAITAEEGAISASADTFTNVAFGAYKFAAIVKVSNEILSDAAYDIDAEVRDGAAEALGDSIASYLATGSNSSQPQGIKGATTGVTAAATTAVTADELIDLVYSVNQRNRANGTFVCSTALLKAVRKLKTGSSGTPGDYVWQPSYVNGEPATLLGYPVYEDGKLEAMTTGKTVAVFGDFKRGFGIRRAGEVEVAVDPSVYFANDQVAYRVKLRMDSKILAGDALRKLVLA
jgi:HK97 family phage major capsid protein